MDNIDQITEVRKRADVIIFGLKDATVDIGVMACVEAATKMVMATSQVASKEALRQLILLLEKIREQE